MKEVYVYEKKGESLIETSERIGLAAKEAGVGLSSRKKRFLLHKLSKEGQISIAKVLPKLHKDADGTNIRVLSDSFNWLLKKKEGNSKFNSYDDVISDCISKLDAIEKMVDDCSGDDSDNKILHESLYELFNGGKR